MRAQVFGLVLSLTLLGCGAGLSGAKGAFRQGDYGRAREQLEALEARSAGWSEASRAEYALYRGLTHHALGDRERAVHWLGIAKELEDRAPNTLSQDDRARLLLALQALN